MRKVVFTLLIFLLLVPIVSAQQTESDNSGVTDALEEETADILLTLPEPGITPDSPLYFLDTLGESLSLSITRSPEKKAEKAFLHAEEKLAEAKKMAEENKEKAANKAVGKHNKYLDEATDSLGKARALGKDVDALAAHIAEKTLKHLAVKSRVYDKLVAKGNLNAAEAVKKSMEKSINGHNKALQAISKKKEELESKGKKVKEKLEEEENGPQGTEEE